MFWTIIILVYALGWLAALPWVINTAREIRIGGKVIGYHKCDWVHVTFGAFFALFWPVWILIKIFGKVLISGS